MLPYSRQDISQEDIDAVKDVLNSDYLTQGPVISRFEHLVASYVGAKHALAMNSATSALHAACSALGLGPGDWLWTSPVTFVASANCGLYCGASVDFVDIDQHTYNLCSSSLEAKLKASERTGKTPKVLVVVHLSGQSCDMSAIYKLKQKYGFKVIEDASHAIGGKYKGHYIGGGHYSDITVFSFHPVKIITTGEGGMALTNDCKLAWKMSLFRSHGITREAAHMTHAPDGPWYYQQIDLGYNYRMTDIQAALGISQLRRLEPYVRRRNEIASRYEYLLKELPLTCPKLLPYNYSSFHLYIIRLRLDKIAKTHLEVFEMLRKNGIGVNLHYIPLHLQPYYQSMGFRSGDYPQSESYYSEAISLPIFPTMTNTQQDEVVSTLRLALLTA